MLQRPTKALLLPALLAMSLACMAEEGSPAPSQDASSSYSAMTSDQYEGWKDMLRRRREVSGNTVEGIKRHAHDGDYVFIRGRFIKKTASGGYVFTDGKDRIEGKFAEGTLPKDFALDEDYMVWGQIRRENVIASYMQVLMLSPRRFPPHGGAQGQRVPQCDGNGCQMIPRPEDDGHEADHAIRVPDRDTEAEGGQPDASSQKAGAPQAKSQSK